MVYGFRDVAIILRQPKSKKSQSTNTLHNERENVFEQIFVLENIGEKQNQIMKIKASGNVHFVYVTSLRFDVIRRLYPKEQEL